MSLITNLEQINRALDVVLSVDGKDMYISITREEFQEVCPGPTLAVHIVANSPADAIKMFRNDGDVAGQMRFRGAVLYLKSASLTMSDLEMIDRAVPPAERFRKCMSFQRPDNGELEIWLFASLVKENESSPV